jgi:hypothetical protein
VVGETEIWLNAADVGAVRLPCGHCQFEAVFYGTDPSGPPSEIRCSNCNMLMAGAAELVKAYRQFIGEVTRDARRRVRFLVHVTTPSTDAR